MATRLRILNWDKYNAKRADVKKPSWYREENTSAQSRSLYGVRATPRYVFQVLKGLASREQSDELVFEPDWFCNVEGAGSFTLREFDDALAALGGRVIEVLEHTPLPPEHEPSALRARAEDVTLRDGRTDETDGTEENSRRSFSSAAAATEVSCSFPTKPADTAALDPIVGDVEIDAWLRSLGMTERGCVGWKKSHSHEQIMAGLREAFTREANDPFFFEPLPTKPFQTRRQRVPEVLDRYIANARVAPPGGAAVVPLSERKAETPEEAIERARREMTEKRQREAEKEREYLLHGASGSP